MMQRFFSREDAGGFPEEFLKEQFAKATANIQQSQNKNTLFYFDLEPVVNRYTEQLSNDWMPYSFNRSKGSNWRWVRVPSVNLSKEIKVGQVLDATSRSHYALQQCIFFVHMIEQGEVKDGDVLFFQDFWTPGIEAVFYTLDIYNIKTRNYAMLHAQTVDEYDFTHRMRDWMRPFELGIDKRMNAIFVGSQIHKEQLRSAGFQSMIHVLSLPFGRTIELNKKDRSLINKKNQIVYTSRFDFEKNPMFMLSVAERFLSNPKNTGWDWIITTGTKEIRSNDQFIVNKIEELQKKNPQFKIITNITKEAYYDVLAESKIQFNSSLQDYVSWTLIEATTFGCVPVYPDFRSFPEIITDSRFLYKSFDVNSADRILNFVAWMGENDFTNILKTIFSYIPELSELGLLIEAYIMFNDWKEHELNIWQQKEYCKEKFKF